MTTRFVGVTDNLTPTQRRGLEIIRQSMIAGGECPECGGRLDIEPNCVIDEPVMTGNRDNPIGRRCRPCVAALCTSCEFCEEVR